MANEFSIKVDRPRWRLTALLDPAETLCAAVEVRGYDDHVRVPVYGRTGGRAADKSVRDRPRVKLQRHTVGSNI